MKEQVMIGLKCCAYPHDGEACGDCPYNYETGCIGQLAADAFDILTKLQNENESLKAQVQAADQTIRAMTIKLNEKGGSGS